LLMSIILNLSLYAEDCIRYYHQVNLLLRLFNFIPACQIKDLSVTSLTLRHNGGFAKPPLRNLLVLSFDKPTPSRHFVHLIL